GPMRDLVATPPGGAASAPRSGIDRPHRAATALAIAVGVVAGIPVTGKVSSTQAIRVEHAAPNRYDVALDAATVADRDFELEWAPQPGHSPAGAFRLERHGDLHYGQLVLAPPTGDADALASAHASAQPRFARETTFVIDTSGSMAGASFRQAVSALKSGIARLQPGARFTVVRFSSSHDSLYPAPRPLDDASRREALAWIDALRAEGGTEMRGAIEQALGSPATPGTVAQVVFMTDGAVGYEA